MVVLIYKHQRIIKRRNYRVVFYSNFRRIKYVFTENHKNIYICRIGFNDNIFINDNEEKIVSSKTNMAINDNVFKPVFSFNSLSQEIRDKIKDVSWKESAPVSLKELSYVKVTYWGFDDRDHIGELIVNKKIAEEVVEIFKELYEERFPIEKIQFFFVFPTILTKTNTITRLTKI